MVNKLRFGSHGRILTGVYCKAKKTRVADEEEKQNTMKSNEDGKKRSKRKRRKVKN